MENSLYIVLASLFGTPILAPILSGLIFRNPKDVQRIAIAILLIFIIIVILAAMYGISIRGYEINISLISFAYLGFGIISVSIYRIKPRYLGISLGILASLPLLAGLFLGSIGMLFIVMIIGDSTPIHVSYKNDTACYVTSFGNATTSDGGYNVVFKKQLPVFTFIEYQVMEKHLINPNFPPTEACTD